MLRSDHVRAIEFMIHAKRTLGELKRGKMDMDAAGFAASGYAFADNAFLGTVFGIKLQRSDALADNHIDYVDELETTTYDTTLLICGAAAGAFTAVDATYTEAGACGVFDSGGGEIINITGATAGANNGTFLSTSGTANTLVLAALPGESVAPVDDAGLTGVVFI